MRVVLDVTPLSWNGGGLQRFTAGLHKALAKVNADLDLWRWSGSQPSSTAAFDGTTGVYHHPANGPRDRHFAGIPQGWSLVTTIHDVIPTTLASNGSDLQYRFEMGSLLRRADAIATVSFAAKADLIRYYSIAGDDITVIYPGIQRFAAESREVARMKLSWLRLPREAPIVICVGLDRGYKNLRGALEAFAIAARTCGDAIFVIAGYHPAQDVTRWMIRAHALGVASRVVFAGRVSDGDLGHLYRTASVLIHLSEAEGLGMPPLEAVLCGVPCVLSDLAVFHETLGNLATYVPGDDPHAAGKAIITAIDRGLVGAVSTCAARFTWRRCAETYVSFYKSIMARQHGAGGLQR